MAYNIHHIHQYLVIFLKEIDVKYEIEFDQTYILKIHLNGFNIVLRDTT